LGGRANEQASKHHSAWEGARADWAAQGAPRALSRMSRGQQVEVWRRALTMRLLRSLEGDDEETALEGVVG
jgi:hypothetical protein